MDYFYPDLLFRPFWDNSTFAFQVQIKFITESSFCECKNINVKSSPIWNISSLEYSLHFDIILHHCYKFQPMYRYIDGVIL